MGVIVEKNNKIGGTIYNRYRKAVILIIASFPPYKGYEKYAAKIYCAERLCGLEFNRWHCICNRRKRRMLQKSQRNEEKLLPRHMKKFRHLALTVSVSCPSAVAFLVAFVWQVHGIKADPLRTEFIWRNIKHISIFSILYNLDASGWIFTRGRRAYPTWQIAMLLMAWRCQGSGSISSHGIERSASVPNWSIPFAISWRETNLQYDSYHVTLV